MGFFTAVADRLTPTPDAAPRWATPGDLARAMDPDGLIVGVQTPALDLIDRAITETLETPGGRLAISMPPQEGKALALNTAIATPIGWTTIGELKVGDRVFDRNGDPCRVTWVSPTWTDRPCYTVRTGDGEAITADAAHEWVARLDRRSSEHICDTTVLARPRQKNAQITGSSKGLVLPDADLPIDPYVLGAWLGDGTSSNSGFTCADQPIIDRIRSAGFTVTRSESSQYGWYITRNGQITEAMREAAALVTSSRSMSRSEAARRVGLPINYVRHLPAPRGRSWTVDQQPNLTRAQIRRPIEDLRALGVLRNKHIPDLYMRGSRDQRMALLQGLVDTDGYVDPRGQVEFCSVSRRLARDVLELVFTLGAKATLHEGRATIDGRDCGPKYRVRFFMAGAAHLPRKAERCADSSVATTRYVWAEAAESVPTRCIEVDSPDHTYLAGRTLLPTHNSSRATVITPLWLLTRKPETRIAIVGCDQDLADGFSKEIQSWIGTYNGDEDTLDLGIRVDPKYGAIRRWRLEGHRGGVKAVGIQGRLTGRPVDALFIDDPIPDMKHADSPGWREDVWSFWQSVGGPRLSSGAPVVVIQTRWHDDDFVGRLSTGDDAKRWRIINIPAIADHNPDIGQTDPLGREPGEWMISARGRDAQEWESIRVQSGTRVFNALYQGRPSPETGDVWQRPWWRHYREMLWTLDEGGAYRVDGMDEIVQSWDCAFKDTKGSDFVVGQVWARKGANVYLLDQVNKRLSFTATLSAIRALTRKWPQATAKYVEDKANGTAVIDTLRSNIGGIVPITPTESKYARASAVSPFIEAGNVHIPDPAVALFDADELVEQAAAFPNGAHDDIVDATSQALSRLLLRAGQGHAWLAYLKQRATKDATPDDASEAEVTVDG